MIQGGWIRVFPPPNFTQDRGEEIVKLGFDRSIYQLFQQAFPFSHNSIPSPSNSIIYDTLDLLFIWSVAESRFISWRGLDLLDAGASFCRVARSYLPHVIVMVIIGCALADVRLAIFSLHH